MIYISDKLSINPELANATVNLFKLWKQYCFSANNNFYNHVDGLLLLPNRDGGQLLTNEPNELSEHLKKCIDNHIQQTKILSDIQTVTETIFSLVDNTITVKPYLSISYMWIYHADSLTMMPFALTQWPKTEDGAYLLGGFPPDIYFYFEGKWLNF